MMFKIVLKTTVDFATQPAEIHLFPSPALGEVGRTLHLPGGRNSINIKHSRAVRSKLAPDVKKKQKEFGQKN
jgi:hypothetical protein